MASFRGDAWKFYLKLRRTMENGKRIANLKEIVELEEIIKFYEDIDDCLLNKIRYRMLKEKKGSGIIPVFVSTIPWLLFIFSKKLHEWLFQGSGYLWIGFAFLYLMLLVSSVIIHFRENAWANVHIEIIDDILKIRKEQRNGTTKSDTTN